MKKEDLNRITDGLAQGAGEAPNGYNIVGAANAIQRVLEPLEEYEPLTASDIPDEDMQVLKEAQEDLQWHIRELGDLLGSLTGNDGSVELPNGERVDLPAAASSAEKTVDLPDTAHGGGN